MQPLEAVIIWCVRPVLTSRCDDAGAIRARVSMLPDCTRGQYTFG